MTAQNRLDVWERRLSTVSSVVPYAVLVLAFSLAWVTRAETATRGSFAGTTVLVCLAALWMLWWVTLHPGWHQRRGRMAVYFVGLMVVYALLQYRSSWFGMFAFAGYVHALIVLPGRWRFVGVGVTGVISATALYGGHLPDRVAEVPAYLLLVVVIVALTITFTFVGQITADQSAQRRDAVTTLAALNSQLEETLRENAGLHDQLLTQAREAGTLDERQRLAREIHDTLAQGLAGIITQLQAAQQAADRPSDWQRHLDNAIALARDSLSEARRSLHAVGPLPLETARLPDALGEVARSWTAMNAATAEVVTTGAVRRVHPDVEIALLRVGQEALANVAKHAEAGRVGLTVSYLEDAVTLDVRDDGVGFDPQAVAARDLSATGNFGLGSMRTRIRQLDGTLVIESEPGSGTAISASIPTRVNGEAS